MDLQQKHQHWLAIFSQHESTGLTITQFCRQQKINTSTFYAWRKKVANHSDNKLPTERKQQLVPLMVNGPSFTTESSLTITTPSGYQLKFDDRLSPANLNALLNVLP